MNLTISLPVPATQLVLDALAKLPYEQSAAVINEIQRQASAQLQAQAQPAAAEQKPEPEPKGEPEASAA